MAPELPLRSRPGARWSYRPEPTRSAPCPRGRTVSSWLAPAPSARTRISLPLERRSVELLRCEIELVMGRAVGSRIMV